MKLRRERGRSALYIGCVYMPTDVQVQLLWIVVTIGCKMSCKGKDFIARRFSCKGGYVC